MGKAFIQIILDWKEFYVNVFYLTLVQAHRVLSRIFRIVVARIGSKVLKKQGGGANH